MQILKVDKLTNEKWLNLFAADYQNNDHKGRWVFASRHADPHKTALRPEAVIIVPILRERGQPPQLVIIKNYRVPVGDYVYELPAGLIEDGEAIEETIRRELLEETALDLVTIREISPPLYSSTGLTDEAASIAFVEARRTTGGKQQLDGSEDIQICVLDHAQVCQLSEKPVRMDGRLWCVLHHYRTLGRLE